MAQGQKAMTPMKKNKTTTETKTKTTRKPWEQDFHTKESPSPISSRTPAPRDEAGRFLPGVSGNPSGSISAFKRQLRSMVNPYIEPLYMRLVKEAASGKRWAHQLFWQDVVPLCYGKATQPMAVAISDAADKVAELLLDVAPEKDRAMIAQKLEEALESGLPDKRK